MEEIIQRTRQTWLNRADILRKEAKLCDVVLYVQGRLGAMVGYPAHKLVLINASRYFEGLFERDNLGSHYHFPSLTEEGLFALLNIIYGHDISEEIKLEDALYAAKYLQVESAVQFLEHKLTEQIQIQSNVHTHLKTEIRSQIPGSQGRRSHTRPPQRIMSSERLSDKVVSHSSPHQRYSDSHSPHSAVSHSPSSDTYSSTFPQQLGIDGNLKYESIKRMSEGESTEGEPAQQQNASFNNPLVIKVESEDEDFENSGNGDMSGQYTEQEMAMAAGDMDSAHSFDGSQTGNLSNINMLQGFGQMDDGSGVTGEQGLSQIDVSGMRLCRVCGAQFPTPGELSEHLRTHRHSGVKAGKAQTTGKQFLCKFCERSFRYKWHLVDHHRVHTGAKPYVCERCGWKFAQHANLLQHCVRIHKYKPSHIKRDESLEIHVPVL